MVYIKKNWGTDDHYKKNIMNSTTASPLHDQSGSSTSSTIKFQGHNDTLYGNSMMATDGNRSVTTVTATSIPDNSSDSSISAFLEHNTNSSSEYLPTTGFSLTEDITPGGHTTEATIITETTNVSVHDDFDYFLQNPAEEDYPSESDILSHVVYYNDHQMAAQQIWSFGAPPLIIVGTIGNVFVIVLMLQKSLRQYTTSLYLLILALADLIILYTGLLRYWIRAIQGFDIRDLSSGGCKLHIFLVYFFTHFEGWILVLVCIERLAAVFWPKNARNIFTKTVATIELVVVAAILFLANLHFFWTYDLVPDISGTLYCGKSRHKYFIDHVWHWLDLCLASLIPFTLMVTGNSAIAIRLVYADYVRKHKLNATINSKMTSMTVILIAISIIFLITTAPIAIFLSTQNYWFPITLPYYEYVKAEVIFAALNILAYMNNALNFLMYCISSSRFRRQLAKVIYRGKVHPSGVPGGGEAAGLNNQTSSSTGASSNVCSNKHLAQPTRRVTNAPNTLAPHTSRRNALTGTELFLPKFTNPVQARMVPQGRYPDAPTVSAIRINGSGTSTETGQLSPNALTSHHQMAPQETRQLAPYTVNSHHQMAPQETQRLTPYGITSHHQMAASTRKPIFEETREQGEIAEQHSIV